MSQSKTKADVERETLRVWQSSAPFWEKHRATVTAMFVPLTDALVEDAKIRSGQSVLDVGGGAGEPSLTIAKVVGSAGRVTCTDPVAEMIASARREGQRQGITNVRFEQCASDSLPFENDTFDAAVSRLSAMFFSDPLGGLSEMLRVVKSGGYVAFVVWAAPDLNPFFQVITDTVSRYIDSPPADPDAPGAFRFAEPGKLAALLEDAGAVTVKERVLSFRIDAPLKLSEFWPVRVELSDTLREKIAQLPPDQLTRIQRDVQDAAQGFFQNDRMNFPGTALVITGRKSEYGSMISTASR
ncbi:MAG TPA: methyltransferase domain-containing protein [Pyrinomonadaceae bacterium]